MRVKFLLAPILVLCFVVNICQASEKFKRSRYIAQSEVAQDGENRPALADKYLSSGQLRSGEIELRKLVIADPSNSRELFGLGILQVVKSFEGLFHDLYHYGAKKEILNRAISRDMELFKNNPTPKKISYTQFRTVVDKFSRGLSAAENTLSKIKDDDVHCLLHIGLIKLDVDGDGQISKEESIWNLLSRGGNDSAVAQREQQELLINFDKGDVHWLRAYCHFLMAICDFYLAHDSSQTFNCGAHLLFANVDSPHNQLSKGYINDKNNSDSLLFDLLATVHTISWEVCDSSRMYSSLRHLETMASQNKTMWKCVKAETDDDREWIPNSKQEPLDSSVKVTDDMIDSWVNLFDRIERVLAGKLLLGFWRDNDGYGIDVREFFTKPTKFDLVLWVQGSAATPYLKKGETTKMETWNELDKAFGNNLIDFAVWLN